MMTSVLPPPWLTTWLATLLASPGGCKALESECGAMGTSDFTNFFLAGTGAGAALIGLLFVAISVRPGLLVSRNTHPAVEVAVAMAFTALVNGFFISFAALLPHASIGGI